MTFKPETEHEVLLLIILVFIAVNLAAAGVLAVIA